MVLFSRDCYYELLGLLIVIKLYFHACIKSAFESAPGLGSRNVQWTEVNEINHPLL